MSTLLHDIEGTSVLTYVLGYVGWVLLAFGPLLIAIAAGQFAKWRGCRLDEGRVHPCKVCGVDIGGLLYALGMFGWLTFFTIYIGGLGAIVWTIAFAVKLLSLALPAGG